MDLTSVSLRKISEAVRGREPDQLDQVYQLAVSIRRWLAAQPNDPRDYEDFETSTPPRSTSPLIDPELVLASVGAATFSIRLKELGAPTSGRQSG